jgi:hypothetical protein
MILTFHFGLIIGNNSTAEDYLKIRASADEQRIPRHGRPHSGFPLDNSQFQDELK